MNRKEFLKVAALGVGSSPFFPFSGLAKSTEHETELYRL